MSVLPLRSSVEVGEREPRVVDLGGEDAEDVFAALGPGTARALLAAVHEEPRTASDLADELDTSVQNVRYHVEKLQTAGLVEVVDTWYSSRGAEMDVYGPACGPVVVAPPAASTAGLRSALSEALAGVVGLAVASGVAQYLLGGASGGPVRRQPNVADETDVATGESVAQSADALLGSVPPGVVVFAVGLVALAAVLAVRYRRPLGAWLSARADGRRPQTGGG
ncbi:MAG: ArsR/SmtB family transcription factor [Halobacteriaceae archaeon]